VKKWAAGFACNVLYSLPCFWFFDLALKITLKMKVSLFLLISTIICLYFGQAHSATTAPKFQMEQEDRMPKIIDNSEDKTAIIVEENAMDEENVVSDEDTEAYLDFVREQMKESIREHLRNIKAKLAEEYENQSEQLILM